MVKAWTFDELYGRNGAFLDGLDERDQSFIGEVPSDFHVWLSKPKVLQKPPENRRGRPKSYPRVAARYKTICEVRNLTKYSPDFTGQSWQKYRIKDTHKGPEVWEIKWKPAWRKTHTADLVSRQGTLIVARNIRTREHKFFYSNRVPGRDGWSLRELLRIAFGRWQVEACFREAKEELGLDHFECRGWHCIHRHLYVTILSGLFCARVRQKLSPSKLVSSGELLTMEQVRRAANVYIETLGLPPKRRQAEYEKEIARQQYYSARNAAASKSHRKRRMQEFTELGIDPNRIKSVPPKPKS